MTAAKKGAAAAKATAKTHAKVSQPRGQKAVAQKPKDSGPKSPAERQAEALKKLNDYNYVKQFGPISGPMYRSTKW